MQCIRTIPLTTVYSELFSFFTCSAIFFKSNAATDIQLDMQTNNRGKVGGGGESAAHKSHNSGISI